MKRRREQRAAIRGFIGGAACLAASAFVAYAWVAGSIDSSKAIAQSDRGNELAFQAAFRDDATQRRVFGELEGDPEGWAGYYVPEKPNSYPKRIVISADGRYWAFGEHDYAQRGRRTDVALAKGPGNGLTLERSFNGRRSRFVYRRETPPRFPQPASDGDAVRFRGVFSGMLARGDSVSVAQLWIWEAEGKQWGKYLWQGLKAGEENWIVAQRDAEIDCTERECRRIVVKRPNEAPVHLTWLGPDALRLEEHDLGGEKIVLHRGEVIPGFLYDLAPRATVAENREWLRAIPADVHWRPSPL